MTAQILSISWSIILLLVFIYLIAKQSQIKFFHNRNSLLLVLAIGLFVRLVPAFFFETGTNFDIESYKLVSEHVVNFEDVYTAEDTINRHPYLPFQMYWMGAANLISNKLAISFSAIVKIFPILADCLVSLLLFLIIVNTKDKQTALFGALLYAVNPISVFVSAYHGQFGAIPILFILLTIYTLEKNKFISGVALGFGVLNKSWPILFFPITWTKLSSMKEKMFFTTAMLISPGIGVLIYSILYDARIFTVIKRAVMYSHGIGVWGYTYFIKMLGIYSPGISPFVWDYFGVAKFVTIAILALIWYKFARHKKVSEGFLLILISFFAFTHAFSIQYLVWIVPFAILSFDYHWLKLYTLGAFSYMFLVYNTLINHFYINNIMSWPEADLLIIIPASLPVWFVTLFWFINKIKQPD